MIEIPNQSQQLSDALYRANKSAEIDRSEYLTPEHVLWSIMLQPEFYRVTESHPQADSLVQYTKKYCTVVPDNEVYFGPEPSHQLIEVINNAFSLITSAGVEKIDVVHMLKAILSLDQESYARQVLESVIGGNRASFFASLIDSYAQGSPVDVFSPGSFEVPDDDDFELDYDEDSPFPASPESGSKNWHRYVTCLNDTLASHNPLIGRKTELDRTIQVLCRKDKNNPLHVGEAGVGKTALAYGLAARIEAGDVPERLLGCKIYSLDIGALMAGTQYRGEFEKRLKAVMNGLSEDSDASKHTRSILYIDEIHTLIGAGKVDGGNIDASNLIKPYLEQGTIAFIGATTYEEYNRSFAKHNAFARRFEKIDIVEPSLDQCREILHQLKPLYAKFHKVDYTDEAIEYAVTASHKYITGRFLPDKAIDLIDEAGAWLETHPDPDADVQIVGKPLIAEVLARICNVDILDEEKTDTARLEGLENRIRSLIYGQDEAVKEVSEAVLMATAGLLDDNKPMASLLFVGPTGVGKTEVARVLASELSLPLIRFDMSEYAEKHTVAKLIGAPAGYVGYDDGGLLTDAVRKTPHCVLLFDELEKAHQDIYNILLQVMDYAVLTDNKGQKTDFRHVIFIMTTNAGAQYARQAGVGFVNSVSAGKAMMKGVRHTFKPEFLNRLTAITVFNDMDRNMASLILEKKLNALRLKLAERRVTLTLTPAATDLLLERGFSAEYGGREIDRVLSADLKPLLMRAMLFGSLADGGEATVDAQDGKLKLV